MLIIVLSQQQNLTIVGTGFNLYMNANLQETAIQANLNAEINLTFQVSSRTWLFKTVARVTPERLLQTSFNCSKQVDEGLCSVMMMDMKVGQTLMVVSIEQSLGDFQLIQAYHYNQAIVQNDFKIPSYVWIIVAGVIAIFGFIVLGFFLKKKQQQLTQQLHEITTRVQEKRDMIDNKDVYF